MKEKSKTPMERLLVGAADDDEEEDIPAVNDAATAGVVRVTVDSGATRSVWPRRKLAAASGTKIEVYDEAVLEFEENGEWCGMRFVDSGCEEALGSGQCYD